MFFISTMCSMEYVPDIGGMIKGGFQKVSGGVSKVTSLVAGPFKCGAPPEVVPTDVFSEMDECLIKSFSENICQRPSPAWKHIIHGYCSRAKIKPGLTVSELYKKVYYNNRLMRAAMLLSSYEQLCPPKKEHEIDCSTFEELRILPSREHGVIDSLVDRMGENTFCSLKRISRATTMKLARMLAVHKPIDELRGWQQGVAALSDCKDDQLEKFINTATRHENYFMATFCAQGSSEIKGHVKALRQYFPKAQVEHLVGLAASPLLHGVYDQFAPENILSFSGDSSFLKQKKFWQEHVKGLNTFLIALTRVGFFSAGKSLEETRRGLFNDKMAACISSLKNLTSEIETSKNIATLNDALQEHLLPLYSSRASILETYNSWAEVSLAFSLSKLLDNGALNYASYIQDKKGPKIHLKDGKSLLLEHSKPYSVDFSDPEKNIALVTGENGSGKSIFMQTLASNVHLALSLGVVPAKELKLTPMEILSSCNIRDSIGKSLWEAQAGRAASVIKKAKEYKGFSLLVLDEPLTASNPKLVDSVLPEILKKLCENNKRIVGMMSTHYTGPIKYVDENLDTFSHIQVNPDHTLTFIKPDAKAVDAPINKFKSEGADAISSVNPKLQAKQEGEKSDVDTPFQVDPDNMPISIQQDVKI